MDREEVKEYLKQYAGLKRKAKRLKENLNDLLYETAYPAMQQSDGSKHQPGKGDRFENSAIRYMQKKEQLQRQIAECEALVFQIEDDVESLGDPWESDVLSRRYLVGGCKLTKWNVVARAMYGDDDEKEQQAVFRLHNQALRSLGEVLDARGYERKGTNDR